MTTNEYLLMLWVMLLAIFCIVAGTGHRHLLYAIAELIRNAGASPGELSARELARKYGLWIQLFCYGAGFLVAFLSACYIMARNLHWI